MHFYLNMHVAALTICSSIHTFQIIMEVNDLVALISDQSFGLMEPRRSLLADAISIRRLNSLS